MRRSYTKESLIAYIRKWAELYGEPPRSSDWNSWALNRKGYEERLRIFREGEWPSYITVLAHFGTWNAGIKAAGLETRPSGYDGEESLKRKDQTWRRQVERFKPMPSTPGGKREEA